MNSGTCVLRPCRKGCQSILEFGCLEKSILSSKWQAVRPCDHRRTCVGFFSASMFFVRVEDEAMTTRNGLEVFAEGDDVQRYVNGRGDCTKWCAARSISANGDSGSRQNW